MKGLASLSAARTFAQGEHQAPKEQQSGLHPHITDAHPFSPAYSDPRAGIAHARPLASPGDVASMDSADAQFGQDAQESVGFTSRCPDLGGSVSGHTAS